MGACACLGKERYKGGKDFYITCDPSRPTAECDKIEWFTWMHRYIQI